MSKWTDLLNVRDSMAPDVFIAAARALPWEPVRLCPDPLWESLGTDHPDFDEAEWHRLYGRPQQGTVQEVNDARLLGKITEDEWRRILHGDDSKLPSMAALLDDAIKLPGQ